MSRGQQTFKQSDVTKAIKATIRAGVVVGRVEIDKSGKIIIVSTKAEDATTGEKPERNEWDGILQ
jgi:hypothetical protein